MDNPHPQNGPVAIITGRYPGTSMTFVDRQVRGLRQQHAQVATFSLRAVAPSQIRGDWQQQERQHVRVLSDDLRHWGANLKALGAALVRPVKTLRALGAAFKTCPTDRAGVVRQIGLFGAALQFAQHLRHLGAVHIHNHLGDSSGTVAMLASHLTGVPFSMTLHGPEIFDDALYWHLPYKIDQATFVICISAYAKEQAARHSAPGDLDKLHVVRCGIEPERYAPDIPPPDAQKLLFIGRLEPRKGAAILIRALDRLHRRARHDVHLTIAGDGTQACALRSDVASLGLDARVTFLGAVDEATVAGLLQQHDALVVPSLSEGLPGVIMEAFASRRAVIAAAVNAVPEIVKNGHTGLAVPPNDPDALADAIATLFDNPHQSALMAQAGESLVLGAYDSRANAQKLLSLIQASGAYQRSLSPADLSAVRRAVLAPPFDRPDT